MRILFAIVISIAFQSSYSQVVSKWRGLGRTGIYEETGLLKEWPEGGPEKLWSDTNIHNGYSSPAMGEEYIYLTGRKDSYEYLTALNYDGSMAWQVEYGLA